MIAGINNGLAGKRTLYVMSVIQSQHSLDGVDPICFQIFGKRKCQTIFVPDGFC